MALKCALASAAWGPPAELGSQREEPIPDENLGPPLGSSEAGLGARFIFLFCLVSPVLGTSRLVSFPSGQVEFLENCVRAHRVGPGEGERRPAGPAKGRLFKVAFTSFKRNLHHPHSHPRNTHTPSRTRCVDSVKDGAPARESGGQQAEVSSWLCWTPPAGLGTAATRPRELGALQPPSEAVGSERSLRCLSRLADPCALTENLCWGFVLFCFVFSKILVGWGGCRKLRVCKVIHNP